MLSQELYLPDLSMIDSTKNSYLHNNVFQLSKKHISEKEMILDILYMLLGLPGSILAKKSGSDQYELPQKYEMTHLSYLGLKNGIKQAVKMCNQTKYIEVQGKRLYEISNNAVVKSFCEAVFDYLQSVKKYFSQILAEINNLQNEEFSQQPTQQTQLSLQNKSIKWESMENINQNNQQNEKMPCKYRKISLLTLTNIISQKGSMLGFIIRCLNTCFIQQQNKSQVVRLLDKMWDIQQQLLPYSQYNENALVKIFKKTLRMFFTNVKEWLKMNKIAEKMDFFILMQESETGNLSEIFLHKNIQIQPLKLPKIIENQSRGILQIGKTIRFIRLYYEDFERQKLMNYLNVDEQFKILQTSLQVEQFQTFKRIKQQKISLNDRLRNKKKSKVSKKCSIPEQNPYEMFSTINTNNFNIKWIQKRQKSIIQNRQSLSLDEIHYGFLFHVKCLLLQILQKINKKCLHFFRDPYDTLIANEKNRIQSSLSNTLIGIKKFMLLQQGDFVQQFLNATSEILDKQKSEVSHNKIYSCIDEAIENSSAKFLPKQILSNIHFDYMKQSDKKAERLRMWVLFCFNYRQDNPINYIFNNSMMEKLKDICNLIFKLKKGQLVLTKIWDEDRETQKGDILKQKVLKRTKILRNSLIAFLNHCVAYLLNKIEVIWCEYRQKIPQSSTVFDIVTQSVQFITKIQKISTLDNLFFNGTMLGLGLVERFRKFHDLIKDPTIVVPIREVQQLEFQLRSIAQIVMKIPELNQMINYNSYFDKID